MSDPHVSVTTFARALGLSDRTVRSWCQRGMLAGAWNVGTGTKWLIPRSTFEHYAGLADTADIADPAEVLTSPEESGT